jgi:hypothetical protein
MRACNDAGNAENRTCFKVEDAKSVVVGVRHQHLVGGGRLCMCVCACVCVGGGYSRV